MFKRVQARPRSGRCVDGCPVRTGAGPSSAARPVQRRGGRKAGIASSAWI